MWLLLHLVACDARDCASGPGGGGGLCLSDAPAAGGLEVYLLAGQSNMDGVSPVTGLPPSLREPQADVRFYWSVTGELGDLVPASTYGPQYTGPEPALGRTLADADRDVVIVKHAV